MSLLTKVESLITISFQFLLSPRQFRREFPTNSKFSSHKLFVRLKTPCENHQMWVSEKFFLANNFPLRNIFIDIHGVTESSKCYTNRSEIFSVSTNKVQDGKQILILIAKFAGIICVYNATWSQFYIVHFL